MEKIGRIGIELAVFLMITLVAFGGFVSLGVSDNSGSNLEIGDSSGNIDDGNGLTGDWRKPSFKKITAAVKKPFQEAAKVVEKVTAPMKEAVEKKSSKPTMPTSTSVSPPPAVSSPTLAPQTAPSFAPKPITCNEYSGGTAKCAWNCDKTDNSLDIIYGDRGSFNCKKNEYCCAYQGNANKPNSELTCKQAARKEGSLEGKCSTNPNAYSPCAGAYPWTKSAGSGTQGRKTSDCQVCCIKI